MAVVHDFLSTTKQHAPIMHHLLSATHLLVAPLAVSNHGERYRQNIVHATIKFSCDKGLHTHLNLTDVIHAISTMFDGLVSSEVSGL